MERNRNRLPAGLLGLLALGAMGASEQDARRASNPNDNARKPEPTPSTGDPELDALLGSLNPSADIDGEGGLGALLAALMGGNRRKSKVEIAHEELMGELAQYGGDSKAATLDAESRSIAAGKPVGLLAASIKVADAEIAEYEDGARFDNDYGVKDMLDLARKVTATVDMRESALAVVSRNRPDKINIKGMELAARVVWGSAIKVIRGFAIVAERNGVTFDPKLATVTPDNAAWTYVDGAINDGE